MIMNHTRTLYDLQINEKLKAILVALVNSDKRNYFIAAIRKQTKASVVNALLVIMYSYEDRAETSASHNIECIQQQKTKV